MASQQRQHKRKMTGTTPRTAPAKRPPKPARAPKATNAKARDPRVPAPGKTITREFKGKTYELTVRAEGYALGDVAFRTLTAAAKAVTKYKAISGPRFWLGAEDEKGGAA